MVAPGVVILLGLLLLVGGACAESAADALVLECRLWCVPDSLKLPLRWQTEPTHRESDLPYVNLLFMYSGEGLKETKASPRVLVPEEARGEIVIQDLIPRDGRMIPLGLYVEFERQGSEGEVNYKLRGDFHVAEGVPENRFETTLTRADANNFIVIDGMAPAAERRRAVEANPEWIKLPNLRPLYLDPEKSEVYVVLRLMTLAQIQGRP